MNVRAAMAAALIAAAAGAACDPGTLDALGSNNTAGSNSAGTAGSATGGSGGSVGGSDAGGTDAGAASGAGGTGGTAGSDAGSGGATTVGKPCDANTPCPSGLFCLDGQYLGAGQASVCTRGCCTSADCGGANSVCWPSPLGGSVCRLASNIGRSTPGTAAAGEPCNQDGDCRSGRCGSDGTCVDTCCSDADCTSTAAPDCVFTLPQNGVGSFTCAAGGNAAPLQTCNANSDCKNGLCLNTSVLPLCAGPCCSSNDCPAIAGLAGSCGYYNAGGKTARLCVLGPFGSAAAGSPCTKNADCRSNLCATLNGKSVCSDACCQDSDCGDPKLGCRPIPVGTNQMRLACVPL